MNIGFVWIQETNQNFFFVLLVTRAIRDSILLTISVRFVRNVPDDDLADDASLFPYFTIPKQTKKFTPIHFFSSRFLFTFLPTT